MSISVQGLVVAPPAVAQIEIPLESLLDRGLALREEQPLPAGRYALRVYALDAAGGKEEIPSLTRHFALELR